MLRHGQSFKGVPANRRRGALHLNRLPEIEPVSPKPVEVRPGYCQRCGVIRLSQGEQGRCHDCEIEYQVELARRYA